MYGATSRQVALQFGRRGLRRWGAPCAEEENMRYVFTSESVTEGHPDKMCDQISDAIVDALITREAELEAAGNPLASVKNLRAAIETFTTTGTIIVMGEVRCEAYVDVQKIVRDVVRSIGYTRAKYGFDADTCGVMNLIHEQSPDIAQGVDGTYARSGADETEKIGAGDQGMMFGYATNETKAYMPMPIYLAHRLAERLARVRKDGTLSYLRPDGKTQVSVVYEDGVPKKIDTVVLSTQHDEGIDQDRIRRDIITYVIAPTLDAEHIEWDKATLYVNPTGRFVVGGPMGDTGLTGRKIIVDTYGGMGRHGGGAFSGKDATKVDRSGAYAARHVAKNIVAAGLADRCEVQLAYAIGVPKPVSIMIDTFGTEKVSIDSIEAAVQDSFDLSAGAIIRDLDLLRPIFRKTAAYGHFGRDDADFSWEKTDKVDELLAHINKL